jgi:hypothetical protein
VAGKRVLKRTFRPNVGRGWEVHVARMGRREMYAEFSAENTKETQNLKLGDNIKLDVKGID